MNLHYSFTNEVSSKMVEHFINNFWWWYGGWAVMFFVCCLCIAGCDDPTLFIETDEDND